MKRAASRATATASEVAPRRVSIPENGTWRRNDYRCARPGSRPVRGMRVCYSGDGGYGAVRIKEEKPEASPGSAFGDDGRAKLSRALAAAYAQTLSSAVK